VELLNQSNRKNSKNLLENHAQWNIRWEEMILALAVVGKNIKNAAVDHRQIDRGIYDKRKIFFGNDSGQKT
jgi:hypothetical protein